MPGKPKRNAVNIYGISSLDKAILAVQDYIKLSKQAEDNAKSTAMELVGLKEVK